MNTGISMGPKIKFSRSHDGRKWTCCGCLIIGQQKRPFWLPLQLKTLSPELGIGLCPMFMGDTVRRVQRNWTILPIKHSVYGVNHCKPYPHRHVGLACRPYIVLLNWLVPITTAKDQFTILCLINWFPMVSQLIPQWFPVVSFSSNADSSILLVLKFPIEILMISTVSPRRSHIFMRSSQIFLLNPPTIPDIPRHQSLSRIPIFRRLSSGYPLIPTSGG